MTTMMKTNKTTRTSNPGIKRYVAPAILDAIKLFLAEGRNPTWEDLEETALCGDRSVGIAIRHLEATGRLIVTRSRGRRNQYQLVEIGGL